MSRFGNIQVRSDPDFVASGEYYGGGFEPYNQGNDPNDRPDFGPPTAGLARIRIYFTGINPNNCTGCFGSPAVGARLCEGGFHGWIVPDDFNPVTDRYSLPLPSGMPISTKLLHTHDHLCAASPCIGPITDVSDGSGTFDWDVTGGNGAMRVRVFDNTFVSIFGGNGFLPANGATIVLPNLNTLGPTALGTGGRAIVERIPI